MAWQLSEGAIESIMSGNQEDKPVFQVLGQKKIAGAGSGSGTDRFRLLLSDGRYSHSSAMLATQLNDKILNGELEQFAVIRLEKYLCNTIQPDRRVMILLDITILASGQQVGAKLGNPQPYKSAGGAAGPALAQPENPPPRAAPVMNGGHSAGGAASAPPKGGSFYGGGGASVAQSSRPFNNQNAPKTPGGTPAKVHPIASLTPYQNRWTIRARVTNKSSVRTWSNSRGDGKLFSMTLTDESGEIKATAFREEVDKFFDMVELNKVYYFSRAQLKTADKRYSSLNNDYEMTFNSESQVTPCEEETNLPSISFNFIAINILDQREPNSMIDVIGVVKNAQDLTTVTSKTTQKEIKKRDLTIVDESKVQVRLTLWGADAENFDASSSPVLAVKGCRLSDWGGRSLSVLQSSQVIINPDIDEAHHLRGWYDNVGHSLDFEEYNNAGGSGGGGQATNWKTFAEVKTEGLGQSDKPDYFTTKGTVVFLKKENCMYQACPTDTCNKKVIDQGNGMFRCEKCNKEFPSFKHRMILQANLADSTDNQWITCFQDTAETILGLSADELGSMKDTNEAAFDQLFADANFKSFVFRMRAKVETYNDESRLKTICVQANPVDFPDYNRRLLENIDKMLSE